MWKTDLNYSEILRSLISCMCAVDPENRITAFELWEWISQYGDPICDKETFVIQEAPNKLHK